MFNMKDKNDLTVLRQLSETNYLLGKADGSLFVIGVLLQNAIELFDENPQEAKKYVADALEKVKKIKIDIYEGIEKL